MKLLQQIQDWYFSNCDGEWEHIYGLVIGTLDNPGWHLQIDLAETRLEDKHFENIEIETSEIDWMFCRVVDKTFNASGDPSKLEAMLAVFVNWAKTDKNWLDGPVNETNEEENRRFWGSLGADVPDEKCKADTCEFNRIKSSSLCREHHYGKYMPNPL